jgi:D-arabinose 1-dehydrogenase-like Zn-dependent alcohol dehydrogenase
LTPAETPERGVGVSNARSDAASASPVGLPERAPLDSSAFEAPSAARVVELESALVSESAELGAPGRSGEAWRGARMLAVRLDGPGLKPRLERVSVPRLAAGEVLLKVLAAGVCHTELQLQDGTLNPGVWPITPGHEIVGEVSVGPAELVGSRVLVYYGRPCGECSFCLAGQEQVCPNAGPQPGLSADGGFAELVRVPADCLVPLPRELDPVAAAPLGCAAATALHALVGVARVEAGETVVVYGVGGVGLALIQLAAVRGARVVAIGRTAAKLELARELGATAVDASATDPVLEVARATGGQGAHAVFELVGAESTLVAGIDMLRRQGRLVLVGYGSAQPRINPLRLVLRETRLLSSLGNTRAELREVVRLAAGGQLRMPIAACYPLESAARALDELRAGRVAGRAVLLPVVAGARGVAPGAAAAPAVADADSARSMIAARSDSHDPASALAHDPSHGASPAASRRASQVEERSQKASRLATRGGEASRHDGEASQEGFRDRAGGRPASQTELAPDAPAEKRADRRAPAPVTATGRPLEAELLEFVGRGLDAARDDAEFSRLALQLFAYQFAHNRPYRLLCEGRGQTPETVRHWRDIPPVPIAAFKEVVLASEPIEGAVEFNSSGTTRPEHKSRHFHPSLVLYDLNARLNFKAHVVPDVEHMRCVVLFPHRAEMPNSSLAHWLTLMVEAFGKAGPRQGRDTQADGHAESAWFVTSTGGLDAERLARTLDSAIALDEPLLILAASFGLVHFLEYCASGGLRFQLPPGSRVMDTGGYKGRSREYARDELYALVTDRLGIPDSHIVNMYGMTEHGTQFLDNTLSAGDAAQRFKVVPPWARTLAVDPQTLAEVPHGAHGLLLHFDLINRASVLAVLSEDVGRAAGDGFELFGRASASEARGCSIALDELIEAVRNSEVDR